MTTEPPTDALSPRLSDFLPPARPHLLSDHFSNTIPAPLKASNLSEELKMKYTQLSFWSRFWVIAMARSNHRSVGSKAACWGGAENFLLQRSMCPHPTSSQRPRTNCATAHSRGLRQRERGRAPAKTPPDKPLPLLACWPCHRPHSQTQPEHTHTRARCTDCGKMAEMYSKIQCPHSRLPLKFTAPWTEITFFRLNLNNR